MRTHPPRAQSPPGAPTQRPTPTAATETSPIGLGAGHLRNDDLGGVATEISRTGSFIGPPHGYTAEPAPSVVASVTSGAGTGNF